MEGNDKIHLERAIFQMEKANKTISKLADKYPDSKFFLLSSKDANDVNIEALKEFLAV